MNKLKPRLTRSASEIIRRFASLLSAGDVGDLLEIPYPQLAYILYGKRLQYAYRVFEVKKRRANTTRTIEAPPASIALLQKKLLHVLNLVVPVKSQAHGFVPGRGIVSNARLHCQKRWVLNLDLENFFPVINLGRVRGAFMARPLRVRPVPATVLAHLCCNQGHLPQGAPTSPAVSNLICRRLDSQLSQLAGRLGCSYSRYADDLTFSTDAKEFPKGLAARKPDYSGAGLSIGVELSAVIHDNGFTINVEKQRLQPYFRRQEVTGLIVNERLTPNRRFRAQVRAMLHAAERYGVEAAEQEFRAKYDQRNRSSGAPSFLDVVRGRLEFLRMVRGGDDREHLLLRRRFQRLMPGIGTAVVVPPPRVPGGRDAWEHWHREYASAVKHLVVRLPNGTHASGTGFYVEPGRIATAAHVLKGDVTLGDEPRPIPPNAIWRTPDGSHVDCGILTVESHSSTCLPLASSMPSVGEEVAALGFPTVPGVHPTLNIATGHVKSISKDYVHGNLDVFQIDCAVSGGMSGGPVINRDGRVIGIVMESAFEETADNAPRQMFHLALPVGYLVSMLKTPKA